MFHFDFFCPGYLNVAQVASLLHQTGDGASGEVEVPNVPMALMGNGNYHKLTSAEWPATKQKKK